MRILIIKTFPVEIKVDKITYNHQEIGLAAALRAKGHICDVMCVADDNMPCTHTVNMNGQEITLYCTKATKILKNGWLKGIDDILELYDILQPCEYNQIFTWHLAKKYKNKVVCYHGPYFCEFNRRYNLMARIFDCFFVNRYRKLNTTFITKSRLAKTYLKDKNLRDVTAVGVGLGISFMDNKEKEQIELIRKIKDAKGIKLLYIGTIEERRNSMFLLDIAKELLERNVSFTLTIVGKPKDEEYGATFWNKAKSLGIENNIIYQSAVEQKNISQVYSVSDMFLLPTRYDIYGMVLLESMYFGMPTLTTENGGSDMMIKSGENGIVIKGFNCNEWCDCISELAKSQMEMKAMGQKAHETIAQHFTWENLADKFLDVYKRKLGN